MQPDQKKLVQVIQAQAQRMLKLVSELLDISRIEAGRMALYREPMSMADAIRDVAERYQMLVAPRKLILEIGTVPLIYGDKTRLAQIVENLVGNAVKFTPPDGSIMIGLREKGKYAEIYVQDTGMGIPPKQLKLLFQRFSKLKVAAGINVRGTGLGLMIVKEVAQMHGGSVRVDSEPGKGTRFSVTLPFYSSSLALAEEFRVMREQSSHEGRDLAIQLLRLKKDSKAPLTELRDILIKRVSREDRILENPNGGLVMLSVVDPEGFAAMRKRIEQVFAENSDSVNARDLRWGWALVPREGTTLTMVLPIAERRAQGE
jgi:two-component sensor histidine kinase